MLRTAVGQGQVIQTEVRNQSPGDFALRQRRCRSRRTDHKANFIDRRRRQQAQIGARVSKGRKQRQITVGAQRFNRYLPEIRSVGRLVGIDQGQKTLASDVAGTGALTTRFL